MVVIPVGLLSNLGFSLVGAPDLNSVPLLITHAEKHGEDQIMVELSDGTFCVVTLEQVLTSRELQPAPEEPQQEK